METLFYTVERQTQELDGIEECTGWKTVYVYRMENNVPEKWFVLELEDPDSVDDAIYEWMDENEVEHDGFDFVWL